MTIHYHPEQGVIVTVNFDQGFRPPEMIKRRLCVVLSPRIKGRAGLCTVIPLSTTAPQRVMLYHYKFQIPFQMPPEWGNQPRWAKCDMICAIGFHRIDLLRLGKDNHGKRRYQLTPLPHTHLTNINKCVLNGLGLVRLTNHL